MKKLPASLLAFLTNHPDKFEEGWSELDGFNGDGWAHWVYLKAGWHNGDPGSHIIHESSVRDVKRAFRLVASCSCEDCFNRKGIES